MEWRNGGRGMNMLKKYYFHFKCWLTGSTPAYIELGQEIGEIRFSRDDNKEAFLALGCSPDSAEYFADLIETQWKG
jgi:hypothetical protein